MLLVLASKQWEFDNAELGATALKIANGKVNLEFGQAVAVGILCNMLATLAIWLTLSARTSVDKIVSIIFPITAFVAAGFEHSIANMYFIPLGILLKDEDSVQRAANLDSARTDCDAALFDDYLQSATSLPELAASSAAVRMGTLDLAVGNLYGSNVMNIGTLIWLDVLYTKAPFLETVDISNAVAGLVAVLLMTIGLTSMVLRAERRRFPFDPAAALILIGYALGLLRTWSVSST